MTINLETKINKIYGMVWGCAIGDALGKPYEGKSTYNNEYSDKPKDVDFLLQDAQNDWTDDTDMLIMIMDNLASNNQNIDIYQLAINFKKWQKTGFAELGDQFPYGIGSQTNFIINQNGFLSNPIKSSRNSYKMMGYENAGNDALTRNSICGITDNWYQNTISHCLITHFDTRCVTSCLVQSYIINCIWKNIPIDWNYIYEVCQNIIKLGYRKTANSIEFEKFWHLGLNYDNILKNHSEENTNTCFLKFLKQLNIGNYELNNEQNYTLLDMTLCIAIILDINYEIKQNKNIDSLYYMIRIKEIISVGGDSDTHASIIGSIIGCYMGFDNIPNKWIKKTKHELWLNNKIKLFIKNIFFS
jgi:ADP-ribosylglycohydrolase